MNNIKTASPKRFLCYISFCTKASIFPRGNRCRISRKYPWRGFRGFFFRARFYMSVPCPEARRRENLSCRASVCFCLFHRHMRLSHVYAWPRGRGNSLPRAIRAFFPRLSRRPPSLFPRKAHRAISGCFPWRRNIFPPLRGILPRVCRHPIRS